MGHFLFFCDLQGQQHGEGFNSPQSHQQHPSVFCSLPPRDAQISGSVTTLAMAEPNLPPPKPASKTRGGSWELPFRVSVAPHNHKQKNQTRTIKRQFPLGCSPLDLSWEKLKRQQEEAVGLCPAKAHETRCRPSKMGEIHWYKGTHGEMPAANGLSMNKYNNQKKACCQKATRSWMCLLFLRRRALGQSRSQPGSSRRCSPIWSLPNTISLSRRA